ncbi:MAG TPA: hypothetical protein VKU44_02065 [Terriglobia bacterium]|nr:hypothetical protein [Terriglobia bacterium]
MSWVTVSCPDGLYELDVEGITRLIRSYAYAKALSDNSEIETESHIIGPDLETVKTDWPLVTNQRESIAFQTANEFYLRMSTGWKGKQGIDYLEDLLDKRDEFNDLVHALQKKASKDTMANIDRSVDRGQTGVEVATFIRDAAAETELALVTGGASLPEAAVGIGLGSVMKGAFKWQDTNSVGQGVAEGSIELVINVFTFGIISKLPARVDRVICGLVFGAVKGALKLGPSSYLSPEDVAKGKKKSVSELLLPAAANIPSAIARDTLRTISNDPRFLVPATVALKLTLRYGAAKLGKPAAPQPLVAQDLATTGRVALNCTLSNNFLDCAKPSEDFVLKSALRPLFSAP